ncbi:hypothetical protein POG22_11290 [Geitlerinema sp. CS-897]|nr:hypothetical protein [Geitlerinema sp. CS-897]
MATASKNAWGRNSFSKEATTDRSLFYPTIASAIVASNRSGIVEILPRLREFSTANCRKVEMF